MTNHDFSRPCTTCGKERYYKQGSKSHCLVCNPPVRPESIIISLTPKQYLWTVAEGHRRQARNVKAGKHDRYGLQQDKALEAHILGVQGELAYAIFSGFAWTPGPEHDTEEGDVFGVQVRTRGKPNYDLYLWEKDPMKFPYVLVTTVEKNGRRVIPLLKLVGWQWGWYVKQPSFKTQLPGTRIEAYWCPRRELRHVYELETVLTLDI